MLSPGEMKQKSVRAARFRCFSPKPVRNHPEIFLWRGHGSKFQLLRRIRTECDSKEVKLFMGRVKLI